MDNKKIRVRQDLERMVINYFLRGDITEDQSSRICDFIDNAIGGGYLPEPYRGDKQGGAVITFPTTYTGPKESADKKQEEEEKEAPEIYAPYGDAVPEGIEDFREALQRDGLVLICYQKKTSHEGIFFDVLWAQSGSRTRNTSWSGAVREEDIPYVLPMDTDYDYKYREWHESLETIYTVNVAPENALKGSFSDYLAYVQSLKDAGMKNDFDYVYVFTAEKRNRFLERNKELVKLKIPSRVLTQLDEREIHTLKDLQGVSIQELQKIKGLGPIIINDTITILKKSGITLKETKEEIGTNKPLGRGKSNYEG